MISATFTAAAKRLLVTLAAATALSAFAATSSAPKADAASYTTLSGTVYWYTGVPATGATVTFYQWTGTAWRQTGKTTTVAGGRYTASAQNGFYYTINVAMTTGLCNVGGLGVDYWGGSAANGWVLANGPTQYMNAWLYRTGHLNC
jgi:hypothetical protein